MTRPLPPRIAATVARRIVTAMSRGRIRTDAELRRAVRAAVRGR